ncbi:MAG: glycine zipper domain-containing protein [Planctomycetes bacterium]|nr:glycine zipper domain-containing protein [Planctomycetota bacterium]
MKSTKLLLAICVVLAARPALGQSFHDNRNKGMTFGALMGALTGAAIGEHNDKPLAGAAIGTAVGALAGAAIGDTADNDIARQQAYRQQQVDYQLAQAASIDQVISMSQAGLGDNVIVTHIQTNGVVYRPQANDLIVLKQAGVSDPVIRAMQTARLATAPPPAPVYRDRVIVEERHYVAPVYPYRAYPWHYPPPRPPYPRSGVHWGVTIGH